jgi:hypothetical protein
MGLMPRQAFAAAVTNAAVGEAPKAFEKPVA